ncbi:MAG: methyltransferase domain-containing protein, partial [Anaerolineales bacterium]|nr:methyltransferase domain-containing protein [Anaerolineales bacterium]
MDTTELADLNRQLVRRLQDKNRFTDPRIGQAFLAVPRHLFLPHLSPKQVYRDRAIATKRDAHGRVISSSSQPSMMAIMLEQLQLEPGHNVLEIGAGTGYNAALMQKLVAPHGRVTTIDFDRDLVETARENLAAANIPNVTVVQGDGGQGYAPHAPYDRIVLTVGAADIAPAWWQELKLAGLLLLPLAFNGPQKSIAFRKQNRYLESLTLRDCGFVRLRGEMSPIEGQAFPLPTEPPGIELVVQEDEAADLDTAVLAQWLSTAGKTQPTSYNVSRHEIWANLSFWLSVQEPALCTLNLTGAWAVQGDLVLFAHQPGDISSGYTHGLLANHGRDGLAVLALSDDIPLHSTAETWPLNTVTYGPATEAQARLQ